jgi:hypothetical protein
VSGSAAGCILAAAGLVPLLAAARPALRAAGLAAWTAGVIIGAGDLLHSPISRLRVEAGGRPAAAAAALAAAALAVVIGGLVAHRWPGAYLLAVVAAAPARIPVHAGGEDANLLLPLYAVLAGGWAATAYEMLRGSERPPALGRVGAAAAAFVAWSAVTMLWTADERQGAITMLFFLLPFGLMLSRLGSLRPGRDLLRGALAIQIGLALVFAAVAFWEFTAKDVFWNPKIIVGNEYAAFFRVNSLFWDASIYGRFMAVTIVLLAGLGVYRRITLPLAGLIAVLFAGMYIAYSQSSLLALAAGALVLGFGIWPRRVTVLVLVAGAVLGLAGLAVALHGNSANSVSSDRAHLVDLGRKVIREHPLAGAGVGGFSRAALRGTAHPGRVGSAASHTTPVTVLAELGPLGLAIFVWLLAEAVRAALRRGGGRMPEPLLLAALAALVASSLFYNAFFEDPAVWILLALIPTVTPILFPPVAAA